MRYKAIQGSQSGHCCFEATVVDTDTPHPIHPEKCNAVCECFEAQDAELIAKALNEFCREPR